MPIQQHQVCLKSNETGDINFFINSWTTNQHYPLQSSSPGKPHTAADVAPTHGSSAASLHVQVPSAGLSRPFGCCPQFQNDELWGGIWVSEKEEVTRTQIRRLRGLRSHWNTLLGQKFVHGDGSVTGNVVVMQHPSVSNLWPETMNPFSVSFKDLTIVLSVNSLSLGHEFLMNNTLTVKKKKKKKTN